MAAQNPYVGPEALSANHRIYGRKTEIESLRDLLIAERVVLLYSPSGAGKTSLIQAGLLRELREKEKFRVCLIRGFRGERGKTNRYLANVYEVLEGALPKDVRKGRESVSSLDEYLKVRPKVATEGPLDADELVLIFDQFEEIFTQDPFDREAKAEFFFELGQALKDRTRWALFSIREDHVAELDDYLHLLPTQLKTRYRLGLLERPQAQQAIEGPADEQGVKFDEGAADVIISDLCQVHWQTETGDAVERPGHVVEPVQLQVVCYRLWEHRFPQPFEPPATISEAEVRYVSVDRALEDFYADQVEEAALAAQVPERDIREWIESKLITAQGLRGQVMWGPQQSGELANKAIECLENAHIVRLETRGSRKWYELTHDRLIEPVADSNHTWWDQHLSLLELRTKEWRARGKSHDFGLSPIEWLAARRWYRANRNTVRPTETEFLSYSWERIRNHYVLPVLVTVLVVAGALGFGFYQRDQKEKLAESEARFSVSSLAYEAQANAMQRSMDEALIGAAQAAKDYQQLSQAGAAGDLAATVRETLVKTLRNAKSLRRVIVGDNTVFRAVAFQPTSPVPLSKKTLFAYAGSGGKIFVSSVDGIFMHEFHGCTSTDVYSLAFSPNGSLLAAGCGDGSVAVWSSNDWLERSRWQAHRGKAWAVAFNYDSTQVVSGGYDNKIKLMQLTSDGSKLRPNAEPADLQAKPSGYIWSIAMSPTENKVVAGDGTSHLWLCDTNTKEASCTSVDIRSIVPVKKIGDETLTDPLSADGTRSDLVKDKDDATLTIAFSEDGKHIATGHWSGSLLVWDRSLTRATQLAQRQSPIYSAAFFDNKGALYVAFGADGLRQVPLVDDPQKPGRMPIADEEIYALSFHAPTGLFAAATLGGSVALIEAKTSHERILRQQPLESDPPAPCNFENKPQPPGPRRGAVVDEGKGARLVVARCEQLLVIEVDKNPQGKIRLLQTLSAMQVGQGPVERVTASIKKQRVATLGKDGTIKFWKLGNTLAEDSSLPPLDAKFFKNNHFAAATPRRILFSSNGDWLFCSFKDEGRLLRIDLRSAESKVPPTTTPIATPFSEVRELALSADGGLLAAGGPFAKQDDEGKADGVAVWDVAAGKLTRRTSAPMRLTSMANKVFELAVVGDRQSKAMIVAGGDLGQINVWDIGNHEVKPKELRMDSRPVTQFAFVPGQALLAAADSQGKITLWDTDSWKMIALTRPGVPVQKVGLLGYANGGGILLSGAKDLTAWDVDIASLRSKVCDILGAGKARGQPPPSKRISEACP